MKIYVIVWGKRFSLAFYLITSFYLSTLIVAFIISLLAPSEPWIRILLFSMLMLVIALIILYRTYVPKADRMVKDLASVIAVRDGMISFPYALDIEVGDVFIEASSLGGKPLSICSFKPMGKYSYVSSFNLHSLPKKYTFAIDRKGYGIIIAPGIRILTPMYRDIVLIFIKPYHLHLPEKHIKIMISGDDALAEANLSIDKGVASGSLVLHRAGKGVKARLEIEAYIEGFMKKYKVTKTLASVDTGMRLFKENMILSEDLMIISHTSILTLDHIMRYLGLHYGEAILLGLGHGDYKLRLILTYYFGKAVRELPLRLVYSSLP